MTVASTNKACWKPAGGAVPVARVIGVHEAIAARLDLGIEAAASLELEGAGAGAADDRAVEPLLAQLLGGAADIVDGLPDGALPLRRGPEMLGAAVIGLQPGEAQVLRAGNHPSEGDRFRTGLHAASRHADVNLYQHGQADAGCFRGLLDAGHVAGIVGAHGDFGDAAQARPAGRACCRRPPGC